MHARGVLAGSFELESHAGSGGMGVVYRARDRETGAVAAIKVLHAPETRDVQRFAQEAQLLSEIRHPGIVRYLGHGITSHGRPYLAMEWLDGETLSARLGRAGLSVDETLVLGGRVAEALAAAHARGIVHRDLKPSNLFLPAGEVARVKLIDFGVARVLEAAAGLTVTGAIIGTPGYMAPEQARAERSLDGRADLFALGCVLFRCLTGQAPFSGGEGIGALVKILLEEPARVREIRPEAPAVVDELVGRLLAKRPADRPAGAEAVAEEIAKIRGALSAGEAAGAGPSAPPSLTSTERRALCLLLARRSGGMGAQRGSPRGAPIVRDRRGALGEVDTAATTLAMAAQVQAAAQDPDAAPEALLRRTAAEHGGVMEHLADGSIVVTFQGAGEATDHAARGARCAIAMRALLGDGAAVALVSGRAVISPRLPVGEVVDRGVGLLRHRPAGIRIDEVTAGLLDVRFDVSGDDEGLCLLREREQALATRKLLGKPTPCVGRDTEIATLEAVFDACVAEPAARAVLVTGPAGIGKSRVRYELLRRLAERGVSVTSALGADEPALRPGPLASIWIARGDPTRASSPFGMIASIVRQAARILEGEPLEVRRQKLRGRVARCLSGTDAARVSELLGELCAVPFPDDESALLRAARQDPLLLGDRMRWAWETWLGAECAARPVLLVLEDLHWGDLPSVRFVDAALGSLADRPWMVLAMARPEVDKLFPDLWRKHGALEIRLGGIPRRAGERLVRHVLGAGVSAETVARVVDQAGGNAFTLEEMIRAVAEGKRGELPETVLSMVQARLEGFEPEARRVLRAASVFGQAFSRGGVAALLGETEPEALLGEWLDVLVGREVIERRQKPARSLGEEYVFRHALVREAAYGMLTDADRALGHRLAALFLERAGESDAAALGEHFEQGGEPARAVPWYQRAAEQALEGNDFATVLARTERGIACGASGAALGQLDLLRGEAHLWRGELADTARLAGEAMALLPPGSAPWYKAAAGVFMTSTTLGNYGALVPVAAALREQEPVGEMGAMAAMATAIVAWLFVMLGQLGMAAPLVERLDRVDVTSPRRNPVAAGWAHLARIFAVMAARNDPAEVLREAEASVARFDEARELRGLTAAQVLAGWVYLGIGAYAEAEQRLRTALGAAERLGLRHVAGVAKNYLGVTLAEQGALDEALAVQAAGVRELGGQGDHFVEATARVRLGVILLLRGAVDDAERESRAAAGALGAFPMHRAYALATLARALLARGEAREALAAAAEAMQLLDQAGTVVDGETSIRLVYAEALDAAGLRAEARAAIGAAKARLLARAAGLPPALRERFLEHVPDAVRTRALARAWVGAAGRG